MISKKLIIVRIVVGIGISLIVGFFIFIIVKTDIIGNIINNKRTVIRTSTGSSLERYMNDVNSKEYNTQKIDKKNYKDEMVKEKLENKIIDKSIFKYINMLRKKKGLNKIDTNTTRSFKCETNKVKDYAKDLNRIQQLYDTGLYDKNAWILIDEDLDGYGYNFYFNDKGKLIYDTVTPDYKVVDFMGREVDDDLSPILYKVNARSKNAKSESNVDVKMTSKVIVSPGATLKSKTKYYDNTINRAVIEHINTSYKFKKTTNGTTYDGSKWKAVSSIRDDGGYVIFNNPNNNFNKIVGKITTQNISKNDNNTYCRLLVYDADIYDLCNGIEEELEPLFDTAAFNYTEPLTFSFTFYRTVNKLRFQIETNGDNKLRICYLKNLRYGFNNEKYKEELEEAKDNEEYMSYLKELGIYKTTEELIKDLKELEEDSTSDYLEYDEWNDTDIYDGVDLSDYDKNVSREQQEIDRRTGPAFDEYLKSLKNFWEIEYGPHYDNELIKRIKETEVNTVSSK